jgi:hypothetical protein
VTAVRLLLDEMYHPGIAEQLQKRGFDVVAIAGDPDRAGIPDDDVLALATGEQRCLVTENVRDFEKLRTQWTKEGRRHAGLLYVSRVRFPRSRQQIGRLISALDGRLAGGRVPAPGQVDWLS